MGAEVTDPDLLNQLNGAQEVTDPAILAQLNGNAPAHMGSTAPMDPASYSPTAGNSFLQNALIGSGKFFTDLDLGARQIGGEVSDRLLGTHNAPSLLQEAGNKQQIDAPIMATGGGRIGQLATGALVGSVMPGATTYAGAGAIGAGYGALQPVASGQSRFQNVGVGAGLGVAGQYAGNTLSSWLKSRAAQPIIDQGLTPAQQAAAAGGQGLGMRLTPGYASGNKALQQFEARLQSMPATSGPFNRLAANNQDVLNSAAANAIGESGNSVDSTVLANAHDRLADVFEGVRRPNSIVYTDPVASSAALDQIDQDASGLIPGSIRDNPLVSQFETLAGQGGVTGEQLGALSSKLGKAAYNNMSSPMGDREMGQALYAVKNHVDDMLASSLDGTDRNVYDAARGQYRNLMNLTSGNTVNPSSGNVSGPLLANLLQRKDKSGFLYGNNQIPMYQAARFAQAFKPVVGDSGTATRSAGGLTQMALAIPGGLFSRAYLSAPGQAIARAATAVPQAISGVGARALAPFAPALNYGLPGAFATLTPESSAAISGYLLK